MAIDVENLYRRYGPMVLRRCRAMLRDEDHARDAMHDVFVQVLRAHRRLDDRAASSLLYRIATNTCLNRIRSHRRQLDQPDSTMVERIAFADVSDGSDARSVLSWLWGKHPESSRVIAVLHLHDGMTLEQVAAEVGMSVSGVRKRLRGLQRSLRELDDAANHSADAQGRG